MRKVFILVVLSAAVLFGGIQLRWTWQAAQNREELAQSWSTDDVQSVATGTFNNNLLVTLYGDAIDCDVLVGNLLQDHQLMQELAARGFTSVQRGNTKAGIQ